MLYSLDFQPRPVRRTLLRMGMLHYHLKAGGVVSVMRDLALALARYARYDPLEIDIIASVDSASDAQRMFGASAGGRKAARIIDIPGLAYRETPYASRSSFIRAAARLAFHLLRGIPLERSAAGCPYILHAHNISLGKNPVATAAFNSIALICVKRNLPLWLINQAHDFAENSRPDRMKAFYTCTGQYDPAFARELMYADLPNIFYVTINSDDIENLRMLGIAPERIFLLPDPIDTGKLERKPLWEDDEWKNEGLPASDYRDTLLRALADFARQTSQLFDPALPMLLFPMKVMRRKNVLEALLLLALFQRLGRRFQLLVSLEANSPADVEYEKRLKKFVAARSLPVLVGFGRSLVSGGAERVVRNGKPQLFSLSDVFALSQAVLTTSLMEGFGFVYHEGWLCGRPVIGRKIPEIVSDFETAGMNFDHLYDKLLVSFLDLPNLQSRLYGAYQRHLEALACSGAGQLTLPAVQDILDAKSIVAGGETCIDFADLNAEMQFELIDRCIAAPAAADRLIGRNPALEATVHLLDEYPHRLIEKNREAIRRQYSLEATARRLERLFETGDSRYRGMLDYDDHADLLRKYHHPRRIRLLLESEGAGALKGG